MNAPAKKRAKPTHSKKRKKRSSISKRFRMADVTYRDYHDPIAILADPVATPE